MPMQPSINLTSASLSHHSKHFHFISHEELTAPKHSKAMLIAHPHIALRHPPAGDELLAAAHVSSSATAQPQPRSDARLSFATPFTDPSLNTFHWPKNVT
mmetsp:Transcript_16571/g.39782  ORF Transcript_16571/g.39782 Transcript_16571/m.39782 type:complete len:100 (-) Transcript_16571:349-648(-)